MASMESEVLDSAAGIERFRKAAAELALSRRSFLALGAAGAAVGAGVLSTSNALAQEPLHNGYAQIDVLNFLLQVKYASATLYSFITQGVDLPGSSGATIGTAQVYNQPKAITFSTQQITDMFNEMYYDELNHVIDLRNLVEAAAAGQPVGATPVAARANLDLSGTSSPGKTPSSTTATFTQSQAIAIARLLEDLSVSACAGAAVYLSGTNLAYVTQMMAADGFHAGALRLIAIQTNAQLQASGYQFLGVTSSAETLVTLTGNLTSGNPTFVATLSVAAPSVGNPVSGNNIPQGTAIKSMVGSVPYVGATTNGSNLVTGLSSVNGLVAGLYVSVYDSSGNLAVPTGTTITAVSTTAPYTLTLSNAATETAGSATVSVLANISITGNITSGSNQVTSVSSTVGLANGQPISGSGIPANATISSISGSTITLSANATATTTKLAITVGAVTVTLTKNALASGVQTVNVIQPDPMDVQPADIGSGAANGPAAISGVSPATYQGFFNTSAAGTSSATGTPAGLAFARNFSSVLQVLFGTNSTNSLVTNQTNEGGFYPYGVSGTINAVQPS